MRKKLITSIIALSLVLCCLVGVTMAWLMDSTKEVVNTFTYGDINIDLTETVGTENKSAATNKVTNDTFKMVPGNKLAKDPKVTVKADSEACYLFIKVEESDNLKDYIAYAVDSNWIALDSTTGVYYREVADTDADQVFEILAAGSYAYAGTAYTWAKNQVLVKPEVTKQMMEDIKTSGMPTLTFTAYAVQSDNVADASAAWDLVKNT